MAGALAAVSVTCVHPDVDAYLHADCHGCVLLMLQQAEADAPRREEERARWLAPTVASAVIDDVMQALTNTTQPVIGRFPDNRSRPSLLPDRALTPEERAAHDEDPRPGVWAGEAGADLRALTQEETDALIRAELASSLPPWTSEMVRLEWMAILGEPRRPLLTRPRRASDPFTGPERLVMAARYQRGGIDSDPLVRLLAYRAWGDRDRWWFELRGVRKGESVECTVIQETYLGVGTPIIAMARLWAAPAHGVALEDGRPGQLVRAQIDTGWLPLPFGTVVRDASCGGVATVEIDLQRYNRQAQQRSLVDIMCRVSDRPRTSGPLAPTVDLNAVLAHFVAQGVPIDQLWQESSADPGAAILWHSPAGRTAPVEERQALARTWVEGGELRYEGPEGVFEPTYNAVQWSIRVSIDPARRFDESRRVDKVTRQQRLSLAVADYSSGARVAGEKSTPPVPKWAKKKRSKNSAK